MLRVNTDEYPESIGLSASYSASQTTYNLDLVDQNINLRDVKAVWARKLWPASAFTEKLTESDAAVSEYQSRLAFMSILPLVKDAYWLNDIAYNLAAESKPLQFKIALEVGLDIPETIISNQPQKIREFCEKHHKYSGVITKRLGSMSQSMDADPDFYYTTLLREKDFDQLHKIILTPQIFQPLIKKEKEVRAIVVGDKIFAGSIDTRESVKGQVDWRQTSVDEGIFWQKESMPEEVNAKLLSLMERLGLSYAAIDLLVDSEGRYIFLEINPAGEWGWLERDLGLPIAKAIAMNLINNANKK